MKHIYGDIVTEDLKSHPAGVRGLKHRVALYYDVKRGVSHPAGVRGLKLDSNGCCSVRSSVAPRRGAWIETRRIECYN